MNIKRVYVFRVMPKRELMTEITHYCEVNNINSAVVIGIIGSLAKVRINYVVSLPAQFESVEYPGPLEIVSAQGTIALKGKERINHIHIQVADLKISTGGHLAEAMIFSTAEVCLGELDFQLHRETDNYTGLNELVE
jgi:predicted DNA-binding protein with PD1-like motif